MEGGLTVIVIIAVFLYLVFRVLCLEQCSAVSCHGKLGRDKELLCYHLFQNQCVVSSEFSFPRT